MKGGGLQMAKICCVLYSVHFREYDNALDQGQCVNELLLSCGK